MANVQYHHFATRKGYNSASMEPRVEEYNGRFGRGYVVEFPNKDGWNVIGHRQSNRYYRIEYYIFK